MTTRTDFKIIVDLTHVYQDVRRLTLVYIDSTKIWHIKQLKDHLIELFQIREPFHLLSTGKTYLPPSEDVRILDQNDVVTVVPGTGLSEAMDNSKSCAVNACSNYGSMVVNVTNGNSVCSNKESKAELSQNDTISQDANGSTYAKFDRSVNFDATSNNTMYHSIMNDVSDLNSSSKMEINSTKESVGTDDQSSVVKKKRVRQRKKKFNNSSDQDINVAKKPRIISNQTVTPAKHIRFNVDKESDASSIDMEEDEKTSYMPELKKTPGKSLEALLALRQTSTPLTFTHKRKDVQEEVQNKTIDKSLKDTSESNKSRKSIEVDPLAVKVSVGDVVDFKILKMDPETYCPTISNTITALVKSISPDNEYELKITSGKQELQGPNGKFSLPDDSNVEVEPETVYYKREELLELQIIRNA